MKLIDVEPILNDSRFHTWKKKDLVEALKNAPEISCKTCIYFKPDEQECTEFGGLASPVNQSDYCSYWEDGADGEDV